MSDPSETEHLNDPRKSYFELNYSHDDNCRPDDPELIYPRPSLFKRFLATVGPGILVMLADTDASCIITAAQTGVQFGYSLLWLQVILIPIVWMAQELTIRLGVSTQKGHGELIKEKFGKGWAWISVATLVIACAGALVSEMSGCIGIAQLLIGDAVPGTRYITVAVCVVFLITLVVTGAYATVERIGIALGLMQVVYVATMFASRPRTTDLAAGFSTEIIEHLTAPCPNATLVPPPGTNTTVIVPTSRADYLGLIASNIGAVVMPFMLFFQQSAVVDKGLRPKAVRWARVETAVGSVLTQLVMAAVIITTAAPFYYGPRHGTPLPPGLPSDPSQWTIGEFAQALHPHLGKWAGNILFSCGMLGGAMVGAIVVSITAAWGLGEVTGYTHTLSSRPRDAPWFYISYAVVVLVAAVIVVMPGMEGHGLVQLNIIIQQLNAALLPIVLGFLVVLAWRAIPPEYSHLRLSRWYFLLCVVVLGTVAAVGLGFAVWSILSSLGWGVC